MTGRKKTGVRTAVLASLEAGRFVYRTRKSPVERAVVLGLILRYGMKHGMGRKRRTPMNVDALVTQWVEALVGMCTAHTKDEYDRHDARADQLLTPILAAPVKQVRAFYAALLERLQSDPRVPMLVWLGFEAWGNVMVKDAPDEGVRRLKSKLAGEIADLVEMEIRDQIPEAIKRALRWRDPETLEEVKEALKEGARPKLVGRESCLFMELRPKGRGKKKVVVML